MILTQKEREKLFNLQTLLSLQSFQAQFPNMIMLSFYFALQKSISRIGIRDLSNFKNLLLLQRKLSQKLKRNSTSIQKSFQVLFYLNLQKPFKVGSFRLKSILKKGILKK